jgi:hypothetical protein
MLEKANASGNAEDRGSNFALYGKVANFQQVSNDKPK